MRADLGLGPIWIRGNLASGTWLCLAGLIVAIFGIGSTASAQAVYGSIFGTVTDSSGAAIPNATITVTDVSKGTSTTTQSGASGDYRAEHLIPDTYKVQASAQGFQTALANNVVVYADTSPKIDLQLAVGGTTTTVEVTAGQPLLETDRADVSTVLNARAVEQLPNLNRNFTAFELLTPGTTYIGWSVGQSQNPQESEQIEVNGQLPFATGYQLDGTDNQDPIYGVAVINPNLDAISEMKVTSQNYDAELGNAVAGMVTAQTKSGSNTIHGSAFEYRRSDAQQARDPFAQSLPQDGRYIPSTLHNQFGGSVGLPIKKDKIFAFGDYQGLREKTGTSVLTTVPTTLAKSTCTSGSDCNLSDYLNVSLGGGPVYQAFDPFSGTGTLGSRTPFANNIIPAGRLSAPAINLMKLMPSPNNGSAIFNNYVGFGSAGFNTDQFDVRGDDQISAKFHAFGRYTRFVSNLNGAAIFGAAGGPGLGAGGFAGTNTSNHQSVAAGGDIAVSTKWATDFRFGWYRVGVNSVGPDYNQPLGTQLGIPNVNQGDLSLTGGLPQFEVSVPSNGQNEGSVVDYGTTTNLAIQQEDSFQGVNNWTHTLGTHTIRFGADIRYAMNHAVSVQNNNLLSGQFDFFNTTTAGGTSGAGQGLGYATLVLGTISNFYQGEYANLNAAERQRRWFFYGQDQWRATHKLTFDYGVRWELLFPERVNGKGNGGLLDLNSGNVRIAGYGPWNDSLNVDMDYAHIAPRVGVAWQVLPNTVVRAGYGRSYGQGWSGDTFGLVLTYSYPTAVTQNITPVNSFDPISFNLSQGPPTYTFPPIPSDGNYPLPNGISLSTRPLTMRIPALDAWNLTVQQQFTHSLALQIGYVGSHGIHNMFDSSNQANVNQQTIAGFNPNLTNPATGLPYTLCDREPYCNGYAQSELGVTFGVPHQWQQSFRYNANQASTKYNALQVVLEQRFKYGLQFQANYTWSQARANESDYFFMSSRADYGNSYYNRRNVFTANANYDLPFGRNQMFGAHSSGWANEIIGGFSMNAVVTAETGLPFTPSYAECSADQDIDGPGGTMCRPDLALVGGFAPHKSAIHIVPGTNSNYVQFFNPVAPMTTNLGVYGPFQRPAVGAFGDIERDAFFQPGLWNVDYSIAKRFALTERVGLQFTAQAFNVFNHVNPGGVSNQVDVPTGGLITSSASNQIGTSLRALQFAARVQF
jgi:Carboxypeptidase regulatory-like domain/TonB dependent receptor